MGSVNKARTPKDTEDTGYRESVQDDILIELRLISHLLREAFNMDLTVEDIREED